MNSSEKIDQLAAALVAAQMKIRNPKKDAKANAGKFSYGYLTLPALIDTIREPFRDTGLAWLQDVGEHPDGVVVTTRILHLSGQWLDFGPLFLPVRGTPQEFGSATSYARRYGLSAAVGIAADEDDDGAAASRRAPESTQARGSGTEAGAVVPQDAVPASQLSAHKAEAGSVAGAVGDKGEGSSAPATAHTRHTHTFTDQPFEYDGQPIPVRPGFEVCTKCLNGRRKGAA